MKHTAKISLLIALALIISVSGVYATWAYANFKFDQAAQLTNSATKTAISIEAVTDTQSVSRGTLVVTGGYTNVSFDQLDNTYAAKLVWTPTTAAPYSVLYTKNTTNVSSNGGEVVPNAIKVNYTVTINYNGTEYNNSFALNAGSSVSVFTATTYTGTVTATSGTANTEIDLAQIIKLSDNFKLPTLTDYNNFKSTVLDKLSITITFADAGAAA